MNLYPSKLAALRAWNRGARAVRYVDERGHEIGFGVQECPGERDARLDELLAAIEVLLSVRAATFAGSLLTCEKLRPELRSLL